MKYFYAILFYVLLITNLSAQDYVDKWDASYSSQGGQEIIDVATNATGETYMLATKFTGQDYDALLVKYDIKGVKLWEKSYSSNYGNSEDRAVRLAVDGDNGNIFVLVNINPDEHQNNLVANGFIVLKYSPSGTLLADYEEVNDFTVKLGHKAYDMYMDKTYSNQAELIYFVTSREGGSNGLSVRLWRLDNDLNFDRATNYDTSADDIPMKMQKFGGKHNVYVSQNSSLVQLIYRDIFASGEATDLPATPRSLPSPIDEIVTVREEILLMKLTNGSYHVREGNTNFTYSSPYTLNDIDYSGTHWYITGSKTVSGHEEMVLLVHNSSTGALEDEILLGGNHGSASSVGASIDYSVSSVEIGGNVVVEGIEYPGIVKYNTAHLSTNPLLRTSLSYYTSATTSDISHSVSTSTEQVLVGSSGNSTKIYAFCSTPYGLSLSNKSAVTGETVILGGNLPSESGTTYLWSTGAETKTISVTQDGTFSVTVYTPTGCPATSDEAEVLFAPLPPESPQFTQPEITSLDSNSPVIRFNWVQKNTDAAGHKLFYEERNPTACDVIGSGGFSGSNPNTSNTYFDHTIGTYEYTFEVASYVTQSNFTLPSSYGSKSASIDMAVNACYDFTLINSVLNNAGLSGNQSVTTGADDIVYSLPGSLDGLDKLFYDWELPNGWVMEMYENRKVTLDVLSGAESGYISAKIVSPFTGEESSQLRLPVIVDGVKIDQSITWETSGLIATVGDNPLTMDGSTSSDLDIQYSSSNTSVATVSGNTINIIGAGTTTITASQSGDTYHNTATAMDRQLTVDPGFTLAFDTNYPQFDYFCCGNYKLFLQLTENGNVYYIVEPDGSSEPTPQQIKDRKNASGQAAFESGSALSLQAGVENDQSQISGLEELTDYDIYLVLENESLELSSVVTKLDVMTQDRSAPIWIENYPSMGIVSSVEAEVQIDLNEESGTVYYAVFPSSTATRFPANIKNGLNTGAIDEGSIAANLNFFTLTGLTAGTDYDVWVAAEDASENLQVSATKLDFSTTTDVITWSGTAWSNGSGPTLSDDVKLNAPLITANHGAFNAGSLEVSSSAFLRVSTGHSLEVIGNLVVNGEMIIESGASLITYEGNSIADNIYFSRDTRYSDGKYSFVGSPVKQSTATTASDLGNNVYTYDEAQSADMMSVSRWMPTNETDQLVPGKGYTQANQKLIEFRGEPNSGTITHTGSYTNDGWHLVSNPYPAAIFIDNFLDANTNTTDAIYIWDDNNSETSRGSNDDYIVANKTAATDISGTNNESRWNNHIGSAQGFFVKLDGASGNITFTEAMRRSGNNADGNFFRKAENESPILRLNLTHVDGLIKQTIVGWNESVSDTEIAEGYDALAFNPQADYAIYTEKAGKYLTIQTITSSKAEVPVGFNVAEAGNYDLTFNLEHLTKPMYLHDQLNDEFVDITEGTYSFYTEAGQIRDRFSLTDATRVLALDDQQMDIYAFDKTLHIESAGSQPTQYQLYDLSGARLMTVNANGKTDVDLKHLISGIYVVSDGIETKKIILK